MKSWVKAWLGAGVGCLVCGVVLTGIGVASGGNKYVKAADLNKMDGAAKKEDNEALLSKTKIDNFDSVICSFKTLANVYLSISFPPILLYLQYR